MNTTFDKLFAATSADVTVNPKDFEGHDEAVPDNGRPATVPASAVERAASATGAESAEGGVVSMSVPGRHSDLRRLRTSYRSLRRVAVLTALGYFVVFLLLSGFAKDLMGRPLFAGLNVGLALGLCQVPVTVLAVVRYERTARRTVDPLAARLRRAGEAR
ncbi:DUF485 domain-containing protein [Streptomyces sp. sk2.1]|uniref:DUF485 domain-containing protein n=1 Tax=Streptomyces sp. sk2.1 TaxID=2478959 RepID=UPI0011E6C28F|nr:DUF485 domain-containing protein [Streptomyces sp. sk2.1]TXS81112.1 DUF485 domain-containing protein [Streptomyces sp. sk2.1]